MAERLPDGYTNFGSGENVLEWIKHNADDLAKAVIPQSPKFLGYKGVPIQPIENFGMALHMTDGQRFILTRQDAELLLNDGLLSRLRVKIELMP